ncbi:5'-3' exoribonuclease 2 [Lamellibrachia satsuma]|nr:5'-3' exoribonuclease 2 [Lamellibrachia satsuma]
MSRHQGYLTNSGIVNLTRVQLILAELGEAEDEIFKRRRDTDLHFKRRNKERKQREKMMKAGQRPSFLLGGQYAPRTPGGQSTVTQPRVQAYQKRMQAIAYTSTQNASNEDAAAALRSMLKDGSEGASTGNTPAQKRKLEETEESDEEPEDEVKLWEDGWKQRYYESKFNVGPDEIDFRHTVGNEYVIGLCWVLLYYYQGCPSWKWYFPYHYAPFASDFCNIGDLDNSFEKNTEPFKPMEQLMGVFPAGSKQFVPPTWQELMTSCDSTIIDFYPTNFKIDLNGKKYAWQGVALLPFVDEKRLRKALEDVYPDLTAGEKMRNTRGADRLFVGKHHSSHDFLEALYEEGGNSEAVELDTNKTEGMGGLVWRDHHVVMTNQTLTSPVPQLEDLHNNQAICIQYSDPKFDPDYIFSAQRLKNAIIPAPTLKPEDFNRRNPNQGYRPQLGFSRSSHYRGSNTRDSSAAGRMVRGQLGAGIAPPQNYYQPRPPFGGAMTGNYPQPGGYQQGGYQGNRQGGGYQGRSQGGGGGYGGGQAYGGNVAWQGNMAGQANAYAYNQQRGYQQQQQNSYGSYGGQSHGGGSGHQRSRSHDSRQERSYQPYQQPPRRR